jgi:hypothetical protein
VLGLGLLLVRRDDEGPAEPPTPTPTPQVTST